MVGKGELGVDKMVEKIKLGWKLVNTKGTASHKALTQIDGWTDR